MGGGKRDTLVYVSACCHIRYELQDTLEPPPPPPPPPVLTSPINEGGCQLPQKDWWGGSQLSFFCWNRSALLNTTTDLRPEKKMVAPALAVSCSESKTFEFQPLVEISCRCIACTVFRFHWVVCAQEGAGLVQR